MRDASQLLWHSIMNTYQIGSHDREPVRYVIVHNRFLGKEGDVFLVDKARLPGVIDISLSQEVESPAYSYSVTCEDKDGLLSPDYFRGKTPGLEAFRGHLVSPWKGQLQANSKIEIHFGYGDQIVRVMTGLIDEVAVNAEAQTITLSGRSMYKRMIDNTVRPYEDSKHLLPDASMTLPDALERAFDYAGLIFKGIPIIDEQSGEEFLIGEPMGLRGETYDTVIKPLVNSVFHYFYELPDGTVEQRELPRFSQKVEAVFTVDDEMHLTALEYKYDDTEIYGTVIVESNRMADAYSSSFLTDKILNGERREVVIEYPWANTSFKRKLAALAYITRMLYKVRTVTITIPANPLLELYDPIRIQEKISTVSSNYHIRSIDYNFNSGGFTQTLGCSINAGFEKTEVPPPPVTDFPDVESSTKKVTLGIWDNGGVDLDIITIRLNGKLVQSNLVLDSTAELISLTLKKGVNVIEFIGVSAGASADLTASMFLEDENKKLLTPTEVILNMPRGDKVNDLGYYQGTKPVRKWVVDYV
ncbi:hypothetical protein ACFPRA_01330 [Sporosarcina soli]|uniref:Uncharacterized protein n=1 Tax=Sporosarcina soli TaxID=334736 RepID=A0ABW0TG96_9BACL